MYGTFRERKDIETINTCTADVVSSLFLYRLA